MTSEREQRERERARQAVVEGRQRARHLSDSLATHREVMARHALNVLTTDHRAFMAAIGKADVTLDVAFTESNRTHDDQPFWRSATKSFTNFSQIKVRVPVPSLRTPLRDFVVGVRGILHHESGHVRFTIPLPELWERGLAELGSLGRPDLSVRSLQMAWNCLEDQRMEAAVVRATPRIATYFAPMVLAYVLAETQAQGYMNGFQKQGVDALGPWLAVAGRDYLPDSVRARARDDFDEFAQPLDLSADDWFDIVVRYLGATTEADMLLALFDAHDFLTRLLDAVGGGEAGGQQHLKTMSMMQTKESLAKKITNASEQHQQMTDSGGTDPQGSASHPKRPEDHPDDDATLGRDQPHAAGAEIDEVLSRVNARFAAGLLSARPAGTARPMYENEIAEARALAFEMRDALEVFRTRHSPVWMHHQEHGYLDPVAYRTRQPGERTYRREPRNYDANGLGLHVSFLADRSGSMWSNMTVLSQTMWATKVACDLLGIPNTMVLWSDRRRTERVLEYDDAPKVYASEGGTDPLDAFDDLDTHVYEHDLHHLVFVFTDGDWATPSAVTEWRRDDRTFAIIGLGCPLSSLQKDAEVVIPISSIRQLGAVVKTVLAERLLML